MNNIKYIGFLFLLSMLCTSCDDSFLDTVPTNTYNEANWWQNEAQVTSSLNGVYNSLNNGIMGHSGYLATETVTPNILGGINFGPPLDVGQHNAGNMDWFLLHWQLNYQGIGRANNLLDNIDRVEMNNDLKERYKGEARFLRALFYSRLVNFYGGVPLILESPSRDLHGRLPRNTREEVVNQILTDLDFASSVLPPSYSANDVGRATQGAALSLKARVLLYESRWAETAAAAKAVIDLNEYELFPDYRGLFLPANENNEEVIFDVQYTAPFRTHGMDNILDVQIGSSPTPDLVNSYLMTDGLPSDESPLYNPSQPYENRDPRLLQTVVIPGYMWKGQIADASKYFNTGFGLKKWTIYEDNVARPEVLPGNSDLNIILIRYADVLLMYAEAQNEANGPDQSVYDALNEIRDRSDMPDVQTGLSQDELREVIRHERRIELAAEGLYYYDIRRWRTAEEVMNAIVYNIEGEPRQTRTFNPARDYLWPIHELILQDNPELEQNPNY
jgi:starch-binding outer membrane protein, SusD/RagB family